MPSKSRKNFDKRFDDVDRLVGIADGLEVLGESSDDFGLPEDTDVLLRSAIVLLVSNWEAYIEDLCAEALEILANRATDPTVLPSDIRKRIAADIKADPNNLSVWGLAGDSWRQVVLTRLTEYRAKNNMGFNTPKAKPTEELIARILGIQEITKAWEWEGQTHKASMKQLDTLVAIRGEIAHRVRLEKNITRAWVADQAKFIKALCAKTGGRVNSYVKRAVGVGLWQ